MGLCARFAHPPGHFGITEGAADTCAALSVIQIALAHIVPVLSPVGVPSFCMGVWPHANERIPWPLLALYYRGGHKGKEAVGKHTVSASPDGSPLKEVNGGGLMDPPPPIPQTSTCRWVHSLTASA